MSGIYSIVSDSKNSLFRFKAAARPWEDREGPATLDDKVRDASGFNLDPSFVRGAAAAKAALEESRNIASPKAAAEDRMARVERRLKEIRQEARLAAARGDREKLASLAREAAQLARSAGRAAKDYATGVSAAAVMGVGGEDRSGSGGGVIESMTRVTQSTTTVQVRQVEFSMTLTVSGDDAAAADSGATASGADAGRSFSYTYSSQSSYLEASHTEASSEWGVTSRGGMGRGSAVTDEDLPGAVGSALAAVGRPIGALGTAEGRQLLSAMISDGEKGVSRYKEADAFARRVEGALSDAKSVISDAKAANMNEPDSKRRAERRKELEELEKSLSEAREEVSDLRGSAFGSSLTLGDLAGALLGGGVGADTGSVDTGGAVIDSAPAAIMVDSAPLVDVTA